MPACARQAQVGTARADELPSLSVSGGYTGLRLPESMVGSEMGGRYGGSSQVAFDFSYGVDLWGGKRRLGSRRGRCARRHR